ncbi:MAG: 6-carboxytetrahydropterin synthase [Bdellovibrionota bacterium]|nr:6-carboxytetrahydropterin synthase [Deltaproteobacteria bacterium]
MESIALEIDFHLEVAHYMEYFGKDHPNHRLHGHSYTGKVVFAGPINPETGILIDFEETKVKLSELLTTYDHCILNEIEGIEKGSSEQLAKHIYHNASKHFPHVHSVWIERPTLGMRVQYPHV